MARGAKANEKPSAPNKAFVRKDPARWKRAGWTSVPNSIVHDEELPPLEAWTWIWLASHTETFEVSGAVLWKANKHIGRDKAYSLLNALEERGLLTRHHEVNERGIPYIVYELQPTPVPPEQRTTKPGNAKARKSAFDKQKQKKPGTPDSYTSRNPNVTSNDSSGSAQTSEDLGFLHVQESERDQHEHFSTESASEGGVSPARVVPERAGESYKEEKTIQKDQLANGLEQASSGNDAPTSDALSWLGSHAKEKPEANSEGMRVLRSLPYGIGQALSGSSVQRWASVVEAALRSGMSKSVVIDKLSSGLASKPRGQRVKIVAGYRLPDLQSTVKQEPTHAAEQIRSAEEQAHAEVTRMANGRERDARRAAGMLGLSWQEPERGNLSTQEYLLETVPVAVREFVEQHRGELVAVLTRTSVSA